MSLDRHRRARRVVLHPSTSEQAALSLPIAPGMLCRRVTPEAARHLIAQLPSKLHPELERLEAVLQRLEQIMVGKAPMK